MYVVYIKINIKMSVGLIHQAPRHEGEWGNGIITPQVLTSAIVASE
jgi:hypothetical protein